MRLPKKKRKDDEIKQIIEAGRRLGVGIDEEKAIKWIADMAAADVSGADFSIDEDKGVFGHSASLLDFDATSLDRIKKIGFDWLIKYIGWSHFPCVRVFAQIQKL